MKVSNLYAFFCVLGTILPMTQFVPWFGQHGVAMHLFVQSAFANQASAGLTLDLVMAATALIAFAIISGRRGVKLWWLPIGATFLVGLSLGLPLLLLLRERQRA